MNVWFINEARIGLIPVLRLKSGLEELGGSLVIEDRVCRDAFRAGNKTPDMVVIVIGPADEQSITPAAAVRQLLHCPVLFFTNGNVEPLRRQFRVACGEDVPVIDVSQAVELWVQQVRGIIAPAAA